MGVVILAVALGKTSCRAAAGGRRAQGMRAPAFSTSVMIALGKAYGPRMVDVGATSARLRRRAVRGRVRDALGGT
jgi:N-acetylmuramic acid 6-phosphate (MurNAc-6-P) etherase